MEANHFLNEWMCGFSRSAEIWNARLAMLSFIIILLIEYAFHITIIYILGFN
uniref:CAB/ELIP/HLIP superfamily protein n=1 Tax=Gastroclonium compressum TaxID=1852973 RepID=A0A173G0B7_GASCM|nr:CAB/ELIP/HLIP superfamily protein [Coeloseira compressa]ANH09718.1 CAB/ELIP/HLIP superfamily protein [Coeloseira compressa]